MTKRAKNLRRRQNNYLDFITPLKIMELSGLEFKNIQISCMLNIFFKKQKYGRTIKMVTIAGSWEPNVFNQETIREPPEA